MILTFLFTLFVLSSLICQTAKDNAPKVVSNVEPEKYLGLWYKIAKIPNRFQKHCVGRTTAQYRLLKEGKIEVINSCIDKDGERDATSSIARIAEGSNNTKLEVSFLSILGINFFWGDYWFIGLDENYEYAIVGTPYGKYGWILS